MTVTLAWWLVLWVALIVAMSVSHAASEWQLRYRIWPTLMAISAAACLSDKTASVFGVAMTSAQNPIKAYLSALVILFSAATVVAVMAHRRLYERDEHEDGLDL
jgi:hypothetical protein